MYIPFIPQVEWQVRFDVIYLIHQSKYVSYSSMDRMTGYEPVDSGSNPDRRIDISYGFVDEIST